MLSCHVSHDFSCDQTKSPQIESIELFETHPPNKASYGYQDSNNQYSIYRLEPSSGNKNLLSSEENPNNLHLVGYLLRSAHALIEGLTPLDGDHRLNVIFKKRILLCSIIEFKGTY